MIVVNQLQLFFTIEDYDDLLEENPTCRDIV